MWFHSASAVWCSFTSSNSYNQYMCVTRHVLVTNNDDKFFKMSNWYFVANVYFRKIPSNRRCALHMFTTINFQSFSQLLHAILAKICTQ